MSPSSAHTLLRPARARASARSGFTLIEILVVVAIIALFATVVAVNVGGQVPKAQRTKAANDIATLESALDQFRIDNGFYPSTEQGLRALVEPPTVGRTARKFRDNGYIKRLPTDPWGNDYLYLAPGLNGEIDIFTYGPDGVARGDGDDADIGNWNLDEG